MELRFGGVSDAVCCTDHRAMWLLEPRAGRVIGDLAKKLRSIFHNRKAVIGVVVGSPQKETTVRIA